LKFNAIIWELVNIICQHQRWPPNGKYFLERITIEESPRSQEFDKALNFVLRNGEQISDDFTERTKDTTVHFVNLSQYYHAIYDYKIAEGYSKTVAAEIAMDQAISTAGQCLTRSNQILILKPPSLEEIQKLIPMEMIQAGLANIPLRTPPNIDMKTYYISIIAHEFAHAIQPVTSISVQDYCELIGIDTNIFINETFLQINKELTENSQIFLYDRKAQVIFNSGIVFEFQTDMDDLFGELRADIFAEIMVFLDFAKDKKGKLQEILNLYRKNPKTIARVNESELYIPSAIDAFCSLGETKKLLDIFSFKPTSDLSDSNTSVLVKLVESYIYNRIFIYSQLQINTDISKAQTFIPILLSAQKRRDPFPNLTALFASSLIEINPQYSILWGNGDRYAEAYDNALVVSPDGGINLSTIGFPEQIYQLAVQNFRALKKTEQMQILRDFFNKLVKFKVGK
jgi:hypothetical protein